MVESIESDPNDLCLGDGAETDSREQTPGQDVRLQFEGPQKIIKKKRPRRPLFQNMP